MSAFALTNPPPPLSQPKPTPMPTTDTITEPAPRKNGSNGNTLLKLDGVTKVFLTDEVETHALSGIHLDIRQGEYVSIAGPSGCGKSTLLSH